MPARLDPNVGLDPRQFDRLNAEFYAAHPAEYFELRSRMLLLAVGRQDEVAALLEQGVEWRQLTLKAQPGEHDPDPAEASNRLEGAAIADAEVIFHHAAECLLRLVVSHIGRPPCPPLEIARQRTPGEFKRQVSKRVTEREFLELRSDLMPLFYGTAELPTLLEPPPAEGVWEEAQDAVTRWVQFFGRAWLEDAPAYNTAKHGLALLAGEGAVTMTGRAGALINRRGATLSFFDLTGPKDDRRWAQRIVFVERDERLAFAMQAARLIKQLWSMAQVHYLGRSETMIQLFKDDLQELGRRRAEQLGHYQLRALTLPLTYSGRRVDDGTSG